MFSGIFNFVFAPIISLHPLISLFFIGGTLTFIITMINKKTLGADIVKTVKKKLQDARSEMLEAQKEKDKEKAAECLNKMNKINSEYIQLMIKPMAISLAISMVLLLTFFPWLNSVYSGKTIAVLPQALPLIGGLHVGWIVWYIICSLVIGLVLRKVLGF